MYKAIHEHVQFSMLLMMMAFFILMTILTSYLYVFKQPIQVLHQQQKKLTTLKNDVNTEVSLKNQIEKQKKLVDQLQIKLNGSDSKLPVNKMVAYVIGTLDEIANRHHVKLSSVKPKNANKLFTFKELPFQVEISGDYFSLFAWLQDVEKELGPIVIKQFDISSIGQEREMLLTIAAYQFEDKR